MRARAVLAAACAVTAACGVAATASAAPPAAARSAELVLPGQPDLGGLQEAARAGLLGPEHPADGQEVEGRARSWRTSRTAPFIITQPAGSTIWGTPTATANSIPRAQVAAVLRRLPQQAVGAEQLPDHEPVLDGGLVRQVRRRADAVRPVPDAGQRLPVLHLGLRRHDARTPYCPTPTATPCNRNIRTDLRAAWEADGRRGRRSPTFDNIFYTVAGEDQSSDLAGVRRDEVHHAWTTVTDAFGPKAYDPTQAGQLGADALRPVVLVGRRDEHLAERAGQQLDRGRELRHGRLRPRAVAQPRHPGQLQQPVHGDRRSGRPPACGT